MNKLILAGLALVLSSALPSAYAANYEYILSVDKSLIKSSSELKTIVSKAIPELTVQAIPMVLDGMYILNVQSGSKTSDLIKRTLSNAGWLKSIENNIYLQQQGFDPSDTYYQATTDKSQRKYLTNSSPVGWAMNAVWSKIRGSTQTTIAILDGGILKNHPDLQGRVRPGYDFVSTATPPTGTPESNPTFKGSNDGDGIDPDPTDPGDAPPQGYQCPNGKVKSSFHGTALASIAAALTNNGQGVAGIDQSAMVLPVRVAGRCGSASAADIINGMYWAIGTKSTNYPTNPYQPTVINLSFGTPNDQANYNMLCAEQGSFYQAAQAALAKGIPIVASVGNDGKAPLLPAACKYSIAVGTVTQNGDKLDYSNYGTGQSESPILFTPSNSGLFVAASNSSQFGPSDSGMTYSYYTGTSFSAPMVSGLIGLAKAANPSLTVDQIKSYLSSTLQAFPATSAPACPNPSSTPTSSNCSCTTTVCGAGIVNAQSFIDAVSGGRLLVNTPGTQLLKANSSYVLSANASDLANASANLTYQWTQLSGDTVTISGANTPEATIQTPATVNGDMVFELKVQSGQTTASNRVLLSLYVDQPQSGNNQVSGTNGNQTANPSGKSSSIAPTQVLSANEQSGSGGGGGALGWSSLLILLASVASLRVSTKSTQ